MTSIQSLEHGQRFPFDASDAWRNKELNAKKPVNQHWTMKAARGVIADLSDRRGIGHGFDDIDEETRRDIVCSLAAIIATALDRA